MKKYAATKPSGVEWLGDVPAHWEVKRLKFVADVHSGIAKGKKYLPNQELVEVPYLRVANVQDGYLNLNDISTISVTPAEAESYQLYPLDILMNEGGDNDKLGRGTVWEGQITPCIHQNHVFAIRHNGTVDSWFLSYFFGSTACKPYFFLSGNQATNLASISSSAIAATPFPAPPLPEQRAIAAFLDARTAHLDGLIRRKEDLLKLLAEQRAALITRAVTRGLDAAAPLHESGVPWLGQVPAHWAVKRLKFMLDGIEQGWSPQCDNHPAETGEWGVLKVGCVNGDEFEPMENKRLPADLDPLLKYEVQVGDVLMSRANTKELVGSTAIVRTLPTKLMLCDKLYRLQVPEAKVNKEFLVYTLRSKVARVQYEQGASGASGSMQNIGQDTVLNLELVFPPLNEQGEIAAAIHKGNKRLDKMTDITNREIARLREYRAALITAAVTGRIDVRAAVVPTPEPVLTDAL